MLALAALTAAPAAAQNAKVEVSGGYQFTYLDGLNIPGGWYVDLTGSVKPAFQVVGEVSGAFKRGASIDGADVKLRTVTAGVRFVSRTNPKVAPYAQVLFGGAHGTGGPLASGGGPDFLAMQIGWGLNAMVTRHAGVRAGADYRRFDRVGIGPSEGKGEFRLITGLVIPF